MALEITLRNSKQPFDLFQVVEFLDQGLWTESPERKGEWLYERFTTGVYFELSLSPENLVVRINYVRPPYWMMDCMMEIMSIADAFSCDRWKWEKKEEEAITDLEAWGQSLYDAWQDSNKNATLAVFQQSSDAKAAYRSIPEEKSWLFYEWNDYVAQAEEGVLPMRYVVHAPLTVGAAEQTPTLQTYAFVNANCKLLPVADLYGFYEESPVESVKAFVLPFEYLVLSPHIERGVVELDDEQELEVLLVKDPALFADWAKNGTEWEDPTTIAFEAEKVLPEAFFSGASPERELALRFGTEDIEQNPWITVGGRAADRPS